MENSFSNRFSKIVLHYIPKEDTEDLLVFRASRIRVSIYIITTFLWLLYINMNLYLSWYIMIPINLFTAFFSYVSAVINRAGVSQRVSTNIFITVNFVGVYANAIFGGGLTSVAGMLLIPACTMLISDKKSAIVWLFICIASLLAVYIAILNGVVFRPTFDIKFVDFYYFISTVGMLVSFYFTQKVFRDERNAAYNELTETNKKLEIEKNRSEALLLNILPEEVAQELKDYGKAEAKQFELVSVLFTDFKDFTQLTESLNPVELVEEINYYFREFDTIISKFKIEKIKTIGDSYMCAGGLPLPSKTHAHDVVNAALEIQSFVNKRNTVRINAGKLPMEIRIGIHSGPVIAGIVGIKKYAYDIWGDTVNTASRLESSGVVGKVNISHTTYEMVKNEYNCVHRGKIEAKNKGLLDMYFVESVV